MVQIEGDLLATELKIAFVVARFNEFVTLGVCKYVSTPDVTKPILTITLHQDFHWLLDDVIIATMP